MSTAAPRAAPKMRDQATLLALLLIACCAVGIGLTQDDLAERVAKVKLRDDVFALPPPSAIKVLSLGYGSAGADFVWVQLLLAYGTHWSKHMYFRDAPRFADDIIALDPGHRPLYSFIDTILIYQPTDTHQSRGDDTDCRQARRYLEIGLEQFPYDGELWLHYGQFIAFLGPAYITAADEADRWRVDGAKAIARAAELGIRVDRTMTASAILGRAGETTAQISFLQRAYALTDDPVEREKIGAKLAALNDATATEESGRVLKTVETSWKRTLPFGTRSAFLLLSPNPDYASCVGRDASANPDCLTSWSDVAQILIKK